jgi:hypothetical protein
LKGHGFIRAASSTKADLLQPLRDDFVVQMYRKTIPQGLKA